MTQYAEQFGLQAESIIDFLKGTGILGALAGVVIILVKFKLVYLLSVEQETEALRMPWGVAKYRRNGRLVRLRPGRHLVIRGFHDIVVVSKREIPLAFERFPVTIDHRTLELEGVISYEVIAPDTPAGDATMLRSVMSVRDTDRQNQTSAGLDAKVRAIVMDWLRQALPSLERDEQGFPLVNFRVVEKGVRKQLKRRHGVRLASFLLHPPAWTAGQQTLDAGRLIADAIGTPPPSGAAPNREVIPLPPRHETA